MNNAFMQRGACALMLVLAVSGGTACGTQVRFPCDGEINTDGSNLRAGPSLNYEVVHGLDRGARVVLTGYRNGWYHVESPEEAIFYVSSRYLSDGTVVCGRLNVRVKPSPKSTVVCQLQRGECVEEIARDAEWAKIKAPDCAELWVSAELITPLPEEDGEEGRPEVPLGVVKQVTPAPAETSSPAGASPEPTPAPAVEAKSKATASPAVEVKPEATASPAVEAKPKATASPAVEAKPEATASPAVEAKPKATASPAVEAKPKATASPAVEAKPKATASPAVETGQPAVSPPAATPAPVKPVESPAAVQSAPVPCRRQGKLVRAEGRGIQGAPYCLVDGFIVMRVVCLVDSRTVNLAHYEGDRVRIWGYELFRHSSGVPAIDVRRLEVE